MTTILLDHNELQALTNKTAIAEDRLAEYIEAGKPAAVVRIAQRRVDALQAEMNAQDVAIREFYGE